MKYSNHLELDVVSHSWPAILSKEHAFIQFGSYLAAPLGLEIRYWSDRTDRNMGIGQTEQTKIWVLARPNRPKYGYWPDRTDQNMGIGQTEQTEIWVFARPNRLKLPLARRKARPKFFPDHCGRLHRIPLSATQVGLANTCFGSRTSSWVINSRKRGQAATKKQPG